MATAGDHSTGRRLLRNLALAVAHVFGYALLLVLECCFLALVTMESVMRKRFHRREHAALNSATGYAAVVAIWESVENLADKPRHLGLLVLEERVDLEAVAKLILWCLAAGAKSISAYDINGTLVQELEKLKEITKNTLVDARIEKSAVEFVVKRPEEEDECERSKDATEQFTGLPVYVVTPNGKSGLIAAFRDICDNFKCGTTDDEDVTQETLDTDLKGEYRGMPAPQLSLRFSGWDSFLSYPPWHIHCSDRIMNLGSHRNVFLSEFIEALHK